MELHHFQPFSQCRYCLHQVVIGLLFSTEQAAHMHGFIPCSLLEGCSFYPEPIDRLLRRRGEVSKSFIRSRLKRHVICLGGIQLFGVPVRLITRLMSHLIIFMLVIQFL